ncbi:MAG: Asp-tRNA(Asn)/Glu-tRNA(Gln) amidotransferase GatCAB subunit C, partial [Gammaproteobacteria bacterium]
MPLSTDEVKRIAYLARVGIREEDIPTYSEQLSRIL